MPRICTEHVALKTCLLDLLDDKVPALCLLQAIHCDGVAVSESDGGVTLAWQVGHIESSRCCICSQHQAYNNPCLLLMYATC